ncbi:MULTISPECIES: hypothetical protein [Streptacidiphilus]|uniref:Uncharacterized protein n=1 Tax=Streptacidiphilus cavernicola TaxID=3342716 RepID=A0ABV6UXA8_9ACTN|nr:hypothetical protein [Streptacidiphilus jeojiense]
MSSEYLRIIADLPDWTPDGIRAEQVEATARQLFETRCAEVTTGDRGTIGFVDPGEWFEDISCPHCGAAIDTSWWEERMDTAAETCFGDLSVSTECCGSATSLNDLAYRQPAGFARFVIEVRELDRTYADDAEIAVLEQAAGCRLRQIAARY